MGRERNAELERARRDLAHELQEVTEERHRVGLPLTSIRTQELEQLRRAVEQARGFLVSIGTDRQVETLDRHYPRWRGR